MAPSTAKYHFMSNDSIKMKNPSISKNIQLTGSGNPRVSTLPRVLMIELLL